MSKRRYWSLSIIQPNKNIVYNMLNDIDSKPYLYSFVHTPNLDRFYIKISGIWESETSIGLVYKFYHIHQPKNYPILFVESLPRQKTKTRTTFNIEI